MLLKQSVMRCVQKETPSAGRWPHRLKEAYLEVARPAVVVITQAWRALRPPLLLELVVLLRKGRVRSQKLVELALLLSVTRGLLSLTERTGWSGESLGGE